MLEPATYEDHRDWILDFLIERDWQTEASIWDHVYYAKCHSGSGEKYLEWPSHYWKILTRMCDEGWIEAHKANLDEPTAYGNKFRLKDE
jgi:hypothetical protein